MKDEKTNKEILMSEMWKSYCSTKDLDYLAKACENAPFFGQSEMLKEIAKKLRELKNNIN